MKLPSLSISTLILAFGIFVLAPFAAAQDPGDGGGDGGGATPPPNPANDETPPALVSVAPDASSVVGSSVTVEGEATDNLGVAKVEYRIQDDPRWREALISEDGADEDTLATSVRYMFRTRLRSGENHTRISIRVIDVNDNESDYLTRKFRRRG
ncbi:hypothetical protein BH23VER1_BH23VER1_26150 [soil metagenome]